MKKILNTRISSLVLRLLFAYFLLALYRIVFVVYNSDLLGDISSGELPSLLLGSLRFDTANMAYTFGVFALLSVLPLSVSQLKKRWYRGLTYGFYLFGVVSFALVNLSDSVYFHFARKRFSAEEFHFFKNSNTFAVMFKAMAENWYLVLLFVLSVVAGVVVYRKTRVQLSKPRYRFLHYTTYTLLSLVVIGSVIIGMRGGLRRDTRPITLSNAAAYAQSPAKASIVLSNPFCILRTLENKNIATFSFFDAQTADSLFSPLHYPVKDSLFGSQRGKNLVVLILESFSAEHSKFLYPDLYQQTLTPFMDSLMGESYTFTRAYANGSKSIDALPSVLSSIPSLGIPFATTPAALSPMDGLGNFLDSLGYDSRFYNGSPSGSMGYDAYARLAGIHTSLSMEDYEAANGKNDYDGYWGIWDAPFLQYFAKDLSTLKQPFFGSVFTLTSHHPFVVPSQYERSLPSGTTKIHKPVAYVDLALRQFFATASTQPWFKNTIFVMVADHVSSETNSDFARTPLGNMHITYFIYTPDKSLKGLDARVTQQIDIKPSLFHLLGNEKPYHAFGRNVFDTTAIPYAVNFNSGMYQWVTGDTSYLFSAESLKAFDDCNNVDVNRLKAFLQEYGASSERKDYTFDAKKHQ